MRTIKQDMSNPLGVSAQGGVRRNWLGGGWGGRRRPATATERWLLKVLLEGLGNPPVTITTWDGQTVKSATTSLAPPEAGGTIRLHLRDPGALLRLVLDPQFQFGELYSSGRIDVLGGRTCIIPGKEINGLSALVESIFVAQGAQRSLFSRLLQRIHAPRSNLHGQAPANIHHHYDLGNDFYRLWLDPQMIYTCAYFPTETAQLEQAQWAKMDMICRKLRLKRGESVVEAGCGWGGLALFMAREYGVRVRAYNLSGRQIAYARQRARDDGLEDRVSFVQADYRAIRGVYDVFVSVGMLEHVGSSHFRELGDVINRSLNTNGRGFIHSIGTDRPAPLNPWIERRIFPGAYPPSLREMMAIFETAHLSVLDVENLRLHYAKTLEHWLARFENAAVRIEDMFGPPFVRAWRLYLSGSLAAFRSGKLQLFQVLFQRHGSNDLAWTREPLYIGNDKKQGKTDATL